MFNNKKTILYFIFLRIKNMVFLNNIFYLFYVFIYFLRIILKINYINIKND